MIRNYTTKCSRVSTGKLFVVLDPGHTSSTFRYVPKLMVVSTNTTALETSSQRRTDGVLVLDFVMNHFLTNNVSTEIDVIDFTTLLSGYLL